jgi:ABC-2 type transport system permease protein
VEKVISSGYFSLSGVSESYLTAITSIETNEADILLEIPSGFEKNLEREGRADVLVAANAVNGTKGGIGSAYLSQIIQSFNAGKGWASSLSADAVRVSYLYNPHLSYKTYMVPGIMVFLLTIVGGFLSALNIVSEKEKGTIEQINVSPVPKRIFIISKLIPFWIIGFILLTLSMVISWLVYGLIPIGSFWIIYLFAAVYLIVFTGFGLAISSVSSTQLQAMFTAYFFMIIFALLSGLFTPINSMPEWAQQVTLFNPVRYFVEVMRMIYLKGSTFTDLAGHFVTLCAFAVFFNLLALWSYRKNS